ncbi:MAG: glycan-binding surface protein [Prevotella sp.]|jgi:hypothetical protein|nr:glycan-binding surface protein [Prevotella sp.]
MKTIKYLIIIIIAVLSFTACSDDNHGSSSLIINKIFLEDAGASVADREVSFARLGQLIRIEGSGFIGIEKILINGYDTYFNNALMTDNNIWVTLNTNTPVSSAADSIRNTITLIKPSESYTYRFVIRSSSPTVSNVSNTLPRPGEMVTVQGENLQEISKITLPGGKVVTENITSDKDGKWYDFIMPEGVDSCGSIVSEGANGIAMTPPYFNDNNCYIIDFDGKGTLGAWSSTNQDSDLVEDPLNSGRGKVAMLIPQNRINAGGVNAGTSNISGWWTAGNNNSDDDWSRMEKFIPGDTPLNELALQFDVYCPQEWDGTGQMEITLQNNLSNYGWASAGTGVSDEYTNQACVWIPWMNRETGKREEAFKTTNWQTVTIPLTWFGNYSGKNDSHTFQDLIKDRNSGSYRNFGFLFCNADIDFDGDASTTNDIYPSSNCSLKIYVDNFRIVKNTTTVVSDFPEE